LHWDVAGEWHDEAASPPKTLPGLRRLLELMRRHDHSRSVVCLVENAERLGPTLAAQAEVRRAVAYAGGTVETAGGTAARPGRGTGVTGRRCDCCGAEGPLYEDRGWWCADRDACLRRADQQSRARPHPPLPMAGAPSTIPPGSPQERPMPAQPLPHQPATTPSLTWAMQFSPFTKSVSLARRLVQRTLTNWGCPPGTVDDAVLVCAELAANAVRHAHVPGTAFGIRLTLTSAACLVEVSDPLTTPPRFGTGGGVTDFDAECGRGLALVTALSSARGHRLAPNGTGKTVWARVPVPQQGAVRGELASQGVVWGSGSDR
jgi:anti-sigma regulatory factor (Ser/Thr protein kinase)